MSNNKKGYIMNGKTMPSRVQMEAEVLKNLLTEVKETVATDLSLTGSKNKALKAIDFWKFSRNNRMLTGSFRTSL